MILLPGACLAESDGHESNGRKVEFLIEEQGQLLPQSALVQGRKIYVNQAGGDPNLDLLYEAELQTLYIINHETRSYYRIDQTVVNKAASMIESLSNLAETQQGVLADLLDTLGISNEQGEVNIDVRETSKTLSSANIPCKLIQQYRNNVLEIEFCMASQENLKALGEHYQTLQSFYAFGDRLINKAGSILSNMGMTMPNLSMIEGMGLPIMVYFAEQKSKVVVTGILNQTSGPENFVIPGGYTQSPIPFIG